MAKIINTKYVYVTLQEAEMFYNVTSEKVYKLLDFLFLSLELLAKSTSADYCRTRKEWVSNGH